MAAYIGCVDSDSMEIPPDFKEINFKEFQDIDDRIVHFMRTLHEAPEEIQIATAQFLSSIDPLKQIFIANTISSKRAEKRHEEASRNLYTCQREYDIFLQKYLVQTGPDSTEAEESLEKSKLEMKITVQTLETAERDLALSKEKLYRASKKAEHTFVYFLRCHSDQTWLKKYLSPTEETEGFYQHLHGKITQVEKPYETYANLGHDTASRNFTETSSDIGSEISVEDFDKTDFHEKTENDISYNCREAPDEIKVIETLYDYPCKVFCNKEKDNNTPRGTNIYMEPGKSKYIHAEGDKSKTNKQPDGEDPRARRPSLTPSFGKIFSKKKKKAAIEFFRSKIHGPWEGWDEI